MDLQTQSHLPALRQRLRDRQNELQAEVRAANEARHDGEQDAEVRDCKDEADKQQRLLSDDVQLARDLAEVQDIQDALARLDAGTYGTCLNCGTPIPAARLDAQPVARLCMPCQSAAETRR
jgi:RNA polymerase-binding protein DksA